MPRNDMRTLTFHPEEERVLFNKSDQTHMDYDQLIDDVETRVSNGAHPEDATWDAVMEATPDNEGGNLRLNALYAKASEEAEENPAYLDPSASDGARMQSVVLAELRLRYQNQSKTAS